MVPATTDIVDCGYGPRAFLLSGVLRRWANRRVRLLRGHWSRWRRARLPIEQ